MKRRIFMKAAALGTFGALWGGHVGAQSVALEPAETQGGKKWFDLEKVPLEGRAWTDEERLAPYDRFPKRWMEKIPGGVAANARHSAGMALRFSTNSKNIWIRYENTSSDLAMYHMSALGKSGFDLYGRDDDGTFRYIKAIQAGAKAEALIGEGLPSEKMREYILYFPLYNGVRSAFVGVSEDAEFQLVARSEKPILFYGTSIVHGACASRPGMPHPAILARRLDLPFWNFGFSGCGKMERIMADAFGELDPSVYVIDCLPNMNPNLVAQNAYPFVKRLRELRPATPIVLVEDRVFPCSWTQPGRAQFHRDNHAALKKVYENLLADGVTNLFYILGEALLPPDGEGTADNSHPNDYGFVYQANAMEPTLRKALGRGAAE
ncbi:MAG: SGNH/GDSL hydrolase family protein [Planctomycetia bacterium]|nr:SGNH/GDSL hydrolase family protein [Planctomycetia bacterium]